MKSIYILSLLLPGCSSFSFKSYGIRSKILGGRQPKLCALRDSPDLIGLTTADSTWYLEQILTAKVYDVAVETPLHELSRLSERSENSILVKREVNICRCY